MYSLDIIGEIRARLMFISYLTDYFTNIPRLAQLMYPLNTTISSRDRL